MTFAPDTVDTTVLVPGTTTTTTDDDEDDDVQLDAGDGTEDEPPEGVVHRSEFDPVGDQKNVPVIPSASGSRRTDVWAAAEEEEELAYLALSGRFTISATAAGGRCAADSGGPGLLVDIYALYVCVCVCVLKEAAARRGYSGTFLWEWGTWSGLVQLGADGTNRCISMGIAAGEE